MSSCLIILILSGIICAVSKYLNKSPQVVVEPLDTLNKNKDLTGKGDDEISSMQLESLGNSEEEQSASKIFRESKISRKRTLTKGNQNVYKNQQNSDQSEQDVDVPLDVFAVFEED